MAAGCRKHPTTGQNPHNRRMENPAPVVCCQRWPLRNLVSYDTLSQARRMTVLALCVLVLSGVFSNDLEGARSFVPLIHRL
jgi:hypothetical protein